ncbi:MAG: two-component system, cell cycle sensor histidine kinase and response regulator CckA [Blastocatellia bacterium]|nr:two-component system, cell cycle sensor histidine kinase and response regulator CckA [Blastocatellia bacterium]
MMSYQVNQNHLTPRSRFPGQLLRDWGGVLTIGLAMVTISYLSWLLFSDADDARKTLITDLVQPIVSLGMTILAFRASRQTALDARTLRAWRVLAVAFFVYFAANVTWFYYETFVGQDLAVTWADALYLAYYPIALTGLLMFPTARSARSRVTFALDAGTVMVGASMVIWYLILRPIALAEQTSTLESVIAAAYPISNTVLLFGVAALLLRGIDKNLRWALGILMVAVLFDAIADFGYSYLTLQSSYEGGNWPDCFYILSFLLMGLSAQVQWWTAKHVAAREAGVGDQRSPFPWLPYLAVALAYGLLLFVSYKHVHRNEGDQVVWLTMGAFVITGLVVVRQIIALRENSRLLSERAARATEARFVSLVEQSSDVISIIRPSGRVLYESPSIERVFGYAPSEMMGRMLIEFVHPDDQAGARELVTTVCQESGARGRTELRLLHKDGHYLDVEAVMTNLLDDPNVGGIVINSRNIVERKRAEEALHDSEEQLRQSQKMDAVGQLAGGVAHDFNNLLAVIIGYSDLLLARTDLPLNEDSQRKVEQISKAGHRAAALTRQLLAFSRKQVLQPKLLDLNIVVGDMDKMLKRLIGEHIEMRSLLEPALGIVKADPGQVEQVLVNLVVNARDAMPAGGKLTIETGNVLLDGQYVHTHRAVEPGPYVMLAVSDTGIGMAADVKTRIFEPFFTTKEKDKGTGLGLSTVYGIVKQSGGSIWVYSEPGQGTTFKIYLPCVDQSADIEEVGIVDQDYTGAETVLLVEDEEMVRQIANEILTLNGYRVLQAAHGNEALEISRNHDGVIDVMITDVVMPLMGGPELAQTLAASRPQMQVLYMSGYTDDTIVHHGVLQQGTAFLQKPFTAEAFTRKLREVISVSQN